jgi:hypothetical protein
VKEANQIPGTPENLRDLKQLLDGWKCCGAPSLCGAPCQDDALSDALAKAHEQVAIELKEQGG